MISRRAAMAGLAAAGGLAATSLSATSATASTHTVFADSFESGGFEKWTRQRIDGNGTMSTVTDPVRHQQRAARWSVPNDGVSYRSEVAVEPWGWDTYRYRFSIMLPEDWIEYEYATILAQWHGYKLANGKSTRPPVELLVDEDHWRLDVHHLTSPTTVGTTAFMLPTFERGVWNDFDLRIAWSTDEHPGELRLLRNDVEWAHHEGVNNYHQTAGEHYPIKVPYFKVGIYRANWNPSKGIDYETGGPDVVVYHDRVQVDRFPGKV